MAVPPTGRPVARLAARCSGHTWHHPDGVLFRIAKHGPAAVVGEAWESDTPAFAGTPSGAEIRAALAFVKSIWR